MADTLFERVSAPAQATTELAPGWDGPRPGDGTAPVARGKFLFVGGAKLYLKGVTYGTFSPEPNEGYPPPERVRADFEAMAGCGVNSLRTYTVPPPWLLDLALEAGLWVLAGVAWEQHIAFLDDRRLRRSIEERVGKAAALCDHPAVAAFAVGNEIPSSLVRWHGSRRVERFIESLYRVSKEVIPDKPVTYVNYPSTEYLKLDFLDVACFNLYLESNEAFLDYLPRLHNVVGDRPLIIAEMGLDSTHHGETAQARLLRDQIRTSFHSGCAGNFVFSWTDEWWRNGVEVEGWSFGLTDRWRAPKPALTGVSEAYGSAPFEDVDEWPRFSVLVCSRNGSATLDECLGHVAALDYPNYEAILVDDGSTDDTARIGHAHRATVIRTPRGGLSNARNVALKAAKGDYVVFLDDDAFPDRHWLRYLALSFMRGPHAGYGGPNLAPPGAGLVPRCLSHTPGGPIHVLLSDHEAEHIPGCNMAFERSALELVGGFDTRFHVAGDDVDICWRLQQAGFSLGFSPAAVVWHHPRSSVTAFMRQQRGYGVAEALLEDKWPDKYNLVGHPRWSGRVYASIGRPLFGRMHRVYHGVWGAAPFQGRDSVEPKAWLGLLSSPEWLVFALLLCLLSVLGFTWHPMLWMAPLGLVSLLAFTARAALHALDIPLGPHHSVAYRARFRALAALLYLVQPLARSWGRLSKGLTAWRGCGHRSYRTPFARRETVWSEEWAANVQWLSRIQDDLLFEGFPVRKGGPYDRWDLEVWGGSLAAVRLRMAIEEHGRGRQQLLFRLWPRAAFVWLGIVAGLALWGARALHDDAVAVGLFLEAVAAFFAVRILLQASAAMEFIVRVIRKKYER